MKELLSVITLTHNKLEHTKVCLSSLLKTNYSPWELIVVDNGSTDGTAAWLEEFKTAARTAGVDVRIILNPDNPGCSTTRNQGARAARGKKLVFIDNDVALRSADWLSTLSGKLDSDKRNTVAGPKLVYPFAPHNIQCAGVAISKSGRVQFRGRGERRDLPDFCSEREVQCLISACFMVKKAAFEKAGGFDKAFNPVEYEDFDLCYRIRSNGGRVLYVPSAEMYHFESVTTTGTPSLPNTYIIIKHGLLFKKKWKHMFEKEDGPPDSATRWRKIPARKLDDHMDLPLL